MHEHDHGQVQRPGGPAPGEPGGWVLTRRSLVALGMLVIAGCAPHKSKSVLRAPDPMWPTVTPDLPGDAVAAANAAAEHAAAGAAHAPAGAAVTSGGDAGALMGRGPVPFAITRQSWARGAPVAQKMDPMLPPRWITVHHDGMKPFFSEAEADSKGRLESIRNAHLHRDEGWGDIGYHFIVDRAGRVWEGRSLRFQGAHVKWCNEHNIGVMCMGNFDEQRPSEAQIEGLERTLAALRTYYRVPLARVRTHREWPSARTACPGASLQAQMVVLRRHATGV